MTGWSVLLLTVLVKSITFKISAKMQFMISFTAWRLLSSRNMKFSKNLETMLNPCIYWLMVLLRYILRQKKDMNLWLRNSLEALSSTIEHSSWKMMANYTIDLERIPFVLPFTIKILHLSFLNTKIWKRISLSSKDKWSLRISLIH